MVFLSDLQSVHNRVLTLETLMASINQKTTSPPVDRTLLAIGNSGSSLAVSLDDVSSIWLSHLDLAPPVKLKLETSAVDAPNGDLPLSAIFPPISLFLHNSSELGPPTITTQLVARLPQSTDIQQQLLDSVDDVLTLHPSFNFQHFQTRVHSMFSWSSEMETLERAAGNDKSPSTSTSRDSTLAMPTLSFFAAASAAFALGSLVRSTSDAPPISPEGSNVAHSDPHPHMGRDSSTSPAVLFVLSEQALAIFERSYNYDLDYMVAMVLQVIYLLHEGKPRLSHTILSLVSVSKVSNLSDDSHASGWENGQHRACDGSQLGPR